MKRIRKNEVILSVAVFSMVALGSCKKKEATPETPQNGTLLFHLHTNIEDTEVESYGDTIAMASGRRVAVTKAQVYISVVQLVKSDGSVIAGPSGNLLQLQGVEQYTVGAATAGNYKSVKFNAGLSAATNATTPSASDPVYGKGMWLDSTNFSGGGGFVFVDFEGLIDTMATPSPGNSLTPFSFRIGTNANLKSVTLPDENFTILANQAAEVHMTTDYAKLFNGIFPIDPSGETSLIIDKNTNYATWSWAEQIVNNIPLMFRYE